MRWGRKGKGRKKGKVGVAGSGGRRNEEYRTIASHKGLRRAGARLRLSCSRSMALLSSPHLFIPTPWLVVQLARSDFLFLARLYQITINIAVPTCNPPPPNRRIDSAATDCVATLAMT